MKNYFLKSKLSLTLIFSLFVCIPFGLSQNKNPNKKKPFYAVEANFGVSTYKERAYTIHSYGVQFKDEMLSYPAFVYGTNFSAGIELTHYFKVGLGLGYLYYKQKDNRLPYHFSIIPDSMTTHGIPLFLYLRSDFLDKKISPYIDFKIGNNFLITKESAIIFDYYVRSGFGEFRLKNGLFLSSNFGIAFKTKHKTTMNVSVGYRYVSREHDFLSPVEARVRGYIRTGYITADHQFVINLGVSF